MRDADSAYGELLRSHTADAIASLVDIMCNKTAPAMTRIRAARLILNIGCGRPVVERVVCEVNEAP